MKAVAPNAVAIYDGIRSVAATTITTSENVSASDKDFIATPLVVLRSKLKAPASAGSYVSPSVEEW